MHLTKDMEVIYIIEVEMGISIGPFWKLNVYIHNGPIILVVCIANWHIIFLE